MNNKIKSLERILEKIGFPVIYCSFISWTIWMFLFLFKLLLIHFNCLTETGVNYFTHTANIFRNSTILFSTLIVMIIISLSLIDYKRGRSNEYR